MPRLKIDPGSPKLAKYIRRAEAMQQRAEDIRYTAVLLALGHQPEYDLGRERLRQAEVHSERMRWQYRFWEVTGLEYHVEARRFRAWLDKQQEIES